MTTSLALASPSAPVVDTGARTITGLAVPFGPAGQTSAGRLTFAAGDLSWSEPRRVKLLVEHDQQRPVGYATELIERPDGLHATFLVPEGAAGDLVLAEAANGLRDALSVGVQLDDATAERLRRAQGTAPVRAVGRLRETSVVSVPAFDDARVGAVAARADLVVSSWTTATAPHPTGEPPVTAPAQPAPAPAPAQPAPAQPAPAPAPAPTPTPAPTDPAQPTQPVVVPGQVVPAAAPVAVAGGAVVTGTPATYTFAGDGPSLALDAFQARMGGDTEAAARLHRYNAELTDGNPSSVMALAAVLRTVDDPPAGAFIQPNVIRRDLVRQQIDLGRPLNSRVAAAGGAVPITNATPFLIPGLNVEFDGVADHVEGTAHVPEGSLTVDGERTLAPRAVSGAFRVSREMVDSSNPAIDRVALQAMLKDYRRKTEAKLVAAVRAGLVAVGGIASVAALRAELIDFGDDDIVAGSIMAGRAFFQAQALDEDADGRPLLPFVGPSNASGTIRAGYTGASVDGVSLDKSSAMPTDEALIADWSTLLVAESRTATFRFDEVEGPGIVKLALFGYYGAARLDDDGVRLLRTAA